MFEFLILVKIIMIKKYPITKEGYIKIQKELQNLKKIERTKVITEIKIAREHGDLSENAEYHAAKEKQGFIEAKIASLENMILCSEIIYPNTKKNDNTKVHFGARVVLLDTTSRKQTEYKIVGEYEADLANGLISIKSPLVQAILGKTINYKFIFMTGKGPKTYTIINISYCEKHRKI